MSIDHKAVLVAGFILPQKEYYRDDEVDVLSAKLACNYVIFNEGYDTSPQYALVPKSLTEDGIKNLEDLEGLLHDIAEIKYKAAFWEISLPEPAIQGKILIW